MTNPTHVQPFLKTINPPMILVTDGIVTIRQGKQDCESRARIWRHKDKPAVVLVQRLKDEENTNPNGVFIPSSATSRVANAIYSSPGFLNYVNPFVYVEANHYATSEPEVLLSAVIFGVIRPRFLLEPNRRSMNPEKFFELLGVPPFNLLD